MYCSRYLSFLTYFLFLFTSLSFSIDLSAETSLDTHIKLLDVWPKEGPKLAWEFEGIGNGYSSVAIKDESIFVTGELDSIGYLFAFNRNGELKWKKEYGKEWIKSYRGSRSVPTVVENHIYICSGLGEVLCLDIETAEVVWSINMVEDLKGKNNVYGYSMQLLIDQDVIYCLPGGSESNIAAINRFNGQIIWTSKGRGETAGYGDAIIVDLKETKLLVCFSEFELMGVNAETGELLWYKELNLVGDIPCNKPIYEDGYLYYVAGPRNGSAKLKLLENGKSIEEQWTNVRFDTSFGGFVKYGDYLYGNLEWNRAFGSINVQNGEINSDARIRSGSIIEEDGLLYTYDQSGFVSLVKPDQGKLELLSKFRITKGTNEHFTHPVIDNGQLFIRHGNALMVYNLYE